MKQHSILLSIFVLLFSISAFAQDVLINVEGDPINCKIVSVTETEIIYKTTEGNLKSLPKSEAMMVQYANGEKINFQKNENSKTETVSETKVNEVVSKSDENGKEIKIEKNKYYIDGNIVKAKQVVSLIKLSNCDEAKKILKKRGGAKALKLISAALIGAGMAVTAITIADEPEIAYIGIGAAVVGFTTYMISSASMSKRLKQAVGEYNSCIHPK